MGDKHANKGTAIRKQGHAKQDLQEAKIKAAKKLVIESDVDQKAEKAQGGGKRSGK